MEPTLLFPLLILLLFIPIFLSGRRQRRQLAEMQAMQSALEPGDVVLTTSGLRGTVVDASYEDTVDIEIADGVVTTWVRAAVREKVTPTVEVAAGSDDAADTPAETGPAETGPVDTDSGDTNRADRPSLQKDDSTNGTARG